MNNKCIYSTVQLNSMCWCRKIISFTDDLYFSKFAYKILIFVSKLMIVILAQTVVKKIREKNQNVRIVGLTATPGRERMFEVAKNLFLQDIVYYPITHPEIKKFWVEEEYITVGYSVDETKLIEILTQMMRHSLQLLGKRNLYDGFLQRIQTLSSYAILRYQQESTAVGNSGMYNIATTLHKLTSWRENVMVR